jgi:pSer/pThr/pTyr-binding forkhead associated (FHA) protein
VRILLRENRYLLADADTPGGTYLNDRRITQPTLLNSGDRIRLGNSVIEFGERQKRK